LGDVFSVTVHPLLQLPAGTQEYVAAAEGVGGGSGGNKHRYAVGVKDRIEANLPSADK
jgi:hypothetical protein